MFSGLFVTAIFYNLFHSIKNAFQSTVPEENWANKDLYHKDLMAGVPVKQRMKNLKNGKYILTKTHPNPHRDPVSGKIIIENCNLYKEDVKNYGAYQAQKWVEQGKYNLTPEELDKQLKEHEEKWKYFFSQDR